MLSFDSEIDADKNEYPPEATIGEQWLRAPAQPHAATAVDSTPREIALSQLVNDKRAGR